MAELGEQCLIAIKSAVGDQLSDTEIKDLADKVVKKAAELRRHGAIYSDPDALLAAVKQISDDERTAALIEKRSRAINVAKKKERVAFYAEHQGDEIGALQALIAGKEGSATGYARSVQALQHAERDRLTTPLSLELERTGLDKRISSFDRDMNLAVYKEMARATGGNEAPTGNRDAETLGKLYADALENARLRRNRAGAWTRSLEGFITPQSHDMLKIRGRDTEADFLHWRDFIATRLDERTFAEIGADPKEREAYLRLTWNSLKSGVHAKSTESDWLMGFSGSQNIAKRASQERSLHFRDATAFFEYHERFGTGTLHEAVLQTLLRAGRDIGLMKVFGTNPRAAFDADVQQLLASAIRRANEGDTKAQAQVNALSGKTMEGRLALSLFDQIDGSADIVGHASLSRVGKIIRGFESLVKLTGGAASSLGDIPLRAQALTWHGQSAFDGYRNGLLALLKGRGDLESRELLSRIGSVAEGVIGDIAARFDVGDRLDGRMAKLVRLEMMLNGQTWWTRTLTNQSIKDISTTLGFYADRSFADLPERLKVSIGRYGITESHWNYVRATTIADSSGRAHVVSDTIRYEDDATIAKMIGKSDPTPTEIARFKDDFEQTLRSYFIDTARESMTEPTAMTKAVATFNSNPGTIAGEMARYFMQFKSFPMALVQRQLNREIYRGGEGAPNWAGLTHMVVAMTVMGYLSGSVKDLLRNRSPKVPEDGSDAVKIITDSFVRGGSMGLLGDIIFNDWTRSGTASGWNLIGPAAGSFADLAGVFQSGVNEATGVKDTNLTSRTVQVVSGHLPFVNLFYLKGAWEYLVLHGLQEWANPGYQQRMLRKMDKDWNQRPILGP